LPSIPEPARWTSSYNMRQVRLSSAFEMTAAALTPNQTPPGHYGLSMMRERATGVGATLSITSQPGHGTEIVIRWVETQDQKDGKR